MKMLVYHAVSSNAPDYKERRVAFRDAHLQRLFALRSKALLVGCALRSDLSAADCFYRVEDPADVEKLIREDPYFQGGVWTGYELRTFGEFVEPWRLPEMITDGSRVVTIVEGIPSDPEMASFALIELRGQGRMAFGGFLGDGNTLTLLNTPDSDKALAFLTETGLWPEYTLKAWSALYVL